MKYGFSSFQINKLLFVLPSIPVEVKWEKGAKGHNIPEFLEIGRGKLSGGGCDILR